VETAVGNGKKTVETSKMACVKLQRRGGIFTAVLCLELGELRSWHSGWA